MKKVLALIFIASMIFSASAGVSTARPAPKPKPKVVTAEFYSPAFDYGMSIPVKYTCDGESLSPPFNWAIIPPNARSLALLCYDENSESGAFVHWLIYNINPKQKKLPEGVPDSAVLPSGARQCINDFGQFGYTGPCPPSGKHIYQFKLLALDDEYWPDPRITPRSLLIEMKDHIIEEFAYSGTYGKRN